MITQPEFDAFPWSTLANSSLGPAETACLDFESARDVTPRWFAVSSGDGNNGVSHLFPDYYCRCAPCDAYTLAAAAMFSKFNGKVEREFAVENTQIDGEADFTISATILDPPEDPDIAAADRDDDSGDDETESWSSVNGAWLIVEVFPVDDMTVTADMLASDDAALTIDGRPAYLSLADCFDESDLQLAART